MAQQKVAALDDYYLYKDKVSTGRLALTSPSVVIAADEDDAVSSLLDIGFDFNFNNTAYSEIMASSNGYAQFGSILTFDTTNNMDEEDSRIMLCPWWDDTMTAFGQTGVREELLGISPYRRYILDYSCFAWFNEDNAVYTLLNYQIVLYETTNIIEFRYEDLSTSGTPDTGSYGASCGVKVDTSTEIGGNFRDFFGEDHIRGGSSTEPAENDNLVAKSGGESSWPGEYNNLEVGAAYTFKFSPAKIWATDSVDSSLIIDSDFTINRTKVMMSEFARDVDQGPFRLSVRGPSNIRGRTTAYSASLGSEPPKR
jgi:hypothetical protein